MIPINAVMVLCSSKKEMATSLIDFSPDFGDHGFDDGTFAVVSSDYHQDRGFCYSVRNPVSIFSTLYDMFLHGKLSRAYLEGY